MYADQHDPRERETSRPPSGDGAQRLQWLREEALAVYADQPPAAEEWLHRRRKDLAGFTPAQCAELGGPALARAAWVLGRRTTTAADVVAPARLELASDVPVIADRNAPSPH